MKQMQDSGGDQEAFAANDPGAEETTKDFSLEDLYILKTLFLSFEKVAIAQLKWIIFKFDNMRCCSLVYQQIYI